MSARRAIVQSAPMSFETQPGRLLSQGAGLLVALQNQRFGGTMGLLTAEPAVRHGNISRCTAAVLLSSRPPSRGELLLV